MVIHVILHVCHGTFPMNTFLWGGGGGGGAGVFCLFHTCITGAMSRAEALSLV